MARRRKPWPEEGVATALMGHSAFKAESMELYSLSILKLLGSRVGREGAEPHCAVKRTET